MASGDDFAALVGRRPDERLLDEDLPQLPEEVGAPEPLPAHPARRRIVAAGVTLTGVTLLGGLALVVLGIVETITGGLDTAAIAALAVGIGLAATHWGWVHVAEATATALDGRVQAAVAERNRAWLTGIAPYARLTVTTSTGPDGSIAIITARHRPVPAGEDRFTFVREVVGREVHSADEPAAVVAERAELLRRQAADATAAERERFGAARDAYESARLSAADERERLEAARAASRALSDQINARLRDPPLTG